INELYTYPKSLFASLNRSLQHIPDVQFAADLLYIDSFALERERSTASNYEKSGDAGEIYCQALRNAFRKVLLLRTSTDIHEWQDNNRQARCVLLPWHRNLTVHDRFACFLNLSDKTEALSSYGPDQSLRFAGVTDCVAGNIQASCDG